MKTTQSKKLNPLILDSLKCKVSDAASAMPDLTGKNVLIGFWHNWPSVGASGYQNGYFKEMQLTDIPEQYNVVAVAFMKGDGIPTFKPYNMSDEEFRRQVGVLNSQGRSVIISLGGADAHISLQKGQEEDLAYEIIRLVETYGFDGLDIDLEQSAITERDNQSVIPDALKLVKDHYKKEGKNFIVSMAPEFPYLRSRSEGASYLPYITKLEGYYDFIAPQYYNQGGDGLWVDELNLWVTQNNDAVKEDFLYYLTDSLTHGTRGFIKIPNNKFVIGIPSNIDAAATGYVVQKEAALNALKRLEQAGNPIRGLMTWSVNWDAGSNKDGKPYNWEFVTRYGEITGTGTTPPPPTEEIPSTPTGLMSPAQTESSISLKWNASTGSNQISHYTIYRSVKAVHGEVEGLTFIDTDLAADTEYEYQVSATDVLNNESEISAAIKVKTLSEQGPGPEPEPENPWNVNTFYKINDQVNYQDMTFVCLAKHTSRVEWTPTNAVSLWKPL